MPTYITNKTNQNLDCWIAMSGPLYYENNMKPGEEMKRKPGYVWFSVNAKFNSGKDWEIDDGKAFVGNMQWNQAFAIAGGFVRRFGDEKTKQYFDAGHVIAGDNLVIKPAQVNSVYGGDDPRFEVHGGDPVIEIQGENAVITSFSSLEIRRV